MLPYFGLRKYSVFWLIMLLSINLVVIHQFLQTGFGLVDPEIIQNDDNSNQTYIDDNRNNNNNMIRIHWKLSHYQQVMMRRDQNVNLRIVSSSSSSVSRLTSNLDQQVEQDAVPAIDEVQRTTATTAPEQPTDLEPEPTLLDPPSQVIAGDYGEDCRTNTSATILKCNETSSTLQFDTISSNDTVTAPVMMMTTTTMADTVNSTTMKDDEDSTNPIDSNNANANTTTITNASTTIEEGETNQTVAPIQRTKVTKVTKKTNNMSSEKRLSNKQQQTPHQPPVQKQEKKKDSNANANAKDGSNNNKKKMIATQEPKKKNKRLNPFDSIPPESIPLLHPTDDEKNKNKSNNVDTNERSMSYHDYFHRMTQNRHECIQHIRNQHEKIIGPYIQSMITKMHSNGQNDDNLSSSTSSSSLYLSMLLVDPAYHENVGDHMLTLGEMNFLQRILQQQHKKYLVDSNSSHTGYSSNATGDPILSLDQCSYDQGRDHIVSCTDFLSTNILNTTDHIESKSNSNSNSTTTMMMMMKNRTIAIWQAGGNWGNLYRQTQSKRIQSFRPLFTAGYQTIVSMPQSLYYTTQRKVPGENKKDAILDSTSDAYTIARNIALGTGILYKYSKRIPMEDMMILFNENPIVKERVVFTWRERYSYKRALELYPFVTNLLVPDIAFQLGPFNGTKYYPHRNSNDNRNDDVYNNNSSNNDSNNENVNNTNNERNINEQLSTSTNRKERKQLEEQQQQQQQPYDATQQRPSIQTPFTDFVFFLRDDDESVFAPQRNNVSIHEIIHDILTTLDGSKTNTTKNTPNHHTMLTSRNFTFSIVDWNDRLTMYNTNEYYFTETAIQFVSSGRVVITDRLHGSILSYLSGIPFVYLDNVSKKINQTLQVAFEQWDGCHNNDIAMYSSATSLYEAIKIAIDFLSRYDLV